MNSYAIEIHIGGQDTKIIRIEDGRVADFPRNGKCSAGTGRFLDVMAGTLGLSSEQLYALAGTFISAPCVRFSPSPRVSVSSGAAILAGGL